MKFVLLLAFVAAHVASQYQSVTFHDYSDGECKTQVRNHTFKTDVCAQHGKGYGKVTCSADGSSITETEYSDSACTQAVGHPHTRNTSQCMKFGGAHGSHEITCDSAAVPITAKHCGDHCRTDPEGPDGVHGSRMSAWHLMREKEHQWKKCFEDGICGAHREAEGPVDCVDGMAGEYPCKGVHQLAFVPFQDLGCVGNSNDIWGWTGSDGREITIHCCTSGSSFVDVTDPRDPVVLGFLPTTTTNVAWRDAKIYKDRVYIIAESVDHGVQVYNMKDLPTRESRKAEGGAVPIFEPEFLYMEHGSSHNIAINEETGYAYSIGSRTCAGGLHIIKLEAGDNGEPEFVGCFSSDGYTHDVECVIYSGPDEEYQGREICFAYNENSLTIVDVDDKDNMHMISRVPYTTSQYTHQGWLNEKQTHLLMNDELDESRGSFPEAPRTRTLIWNVEDLDHPVWQGSHIHVDDAIDHNLYLLDDVAYLSNYCAGLRVLDAQHLEHTIEMEEIAYFDLAPYCSRAVFQGSWSNYPYFKSGIIVVTSIERGLFILELDAEVKARLASRNTTASA